MPRIRYLKPEFFSDESLSDLPFETRLTFAGLWCYADRRGRLECRPKYLKAMIFPYDEIDFEKELEKLSEPKNSGQPFIIRYTIENKEYIQILSWEKHQKPHKSERDSTLPEMPEDVKNTLKTRCLPCKRRLYIGTGTGIVTGTDNGDGDGYITQPTLKTRLFLFEEFWKIYPSRNGKKAGKAEALKEWKSIKPTQELFDEIMSALKKQIEHKQECDAKKVFCPDFKDACRWLKKQCWKDEIKTFTEIEMEKFKAEEAAYARTHPRD